MSRTSRSAIVTETALTRNKERLPKTFRSEAMQGWYRGLKNPETPYPHHILGSLLKSSASPGDLSRLSQHWAPFLNAADECLGCITQEWGKFDGYFPADTNRLSALCRELARFCDRYAP